MDFVLPLWIIIIHMIGMSTLGFMIGAFLTKSEEGFTFFVTLLLFIMTVVYFNFVDCGTC